MRKYAWIYIGNSDDTGARTIVDTHPHGTPNMAAALSHDSYTRYDVSCNGSHPDPVTIPFDWVCT